MGKILMLLMISLLFSNVTHSQNTNTSKPIIEIDPPYGVVSLIVQPDSPVSIIETQLLTDLNGSFPQLRYVVKNKTSNEILSVTVDFYNKHNVASWFKHANGWSETTGNKEGSRAVIGPYGTYENMRRKPTRPLVNSVISEFDDRKNKGVLLGLWVGFVRNVVFVDGREYNFQLNSDDFRGLLLDH